MHCGLFIFAFSENLFASNKITIQYTLFLYVMTYRVISKRAGLVSVRGSAVSEGFFQYGN